jgi:hypothetical protein
MTEIKIGDILPHRLTGKLMKVVSITENEGAAICRCEQMDEPQVWHTSTGTMRYQIAICSAENLTEDKSQLPLF